MTSKNQLEKIELVKLLIHLYLDGFSNISLRFEASHWFAIGQIENIEFIIL
jgi:hypothetical protein